MSTNASLLYARSDYRDRPQVSPAGRPGDGIQPGARADDLVGRGVEPGLADQARAVLTLRVPGRHMRRVRRSIGAGAKEPIVVVSVDVMRLHHPHEVQRIGAAWKAAISIMELQIALAHGESFRADPDCPGGTRCLRRRHAAGLSFEFLADAPAATGPKVLTG
jgi:hypothetical protein